MLILTIDLADIHLGNEVKPTQAINMQPGVQYSVVAACYFLWPLKYSKCSVVCYTAC